MSRDVPTARAPLLSFVLVVRREQAYVEECAASLLAADHPDVEVVVIDDASADRSPGLLDALAEGDARLRVRHLDEPVGPGPARDLALEAVEGEYVWFVNPTDLLVPGALAAVAERLRE